MNRSVQSIYPPPSYHWVGNGFRVHNFFPSNSDIGIYRMSPWFLMDYGSKFDFPPGKEPRGVDVHPHRGIETVTIAYHGKVAHHDSAGNGGVIGEGDVQWMTAGGGILHKEYHEEEFNKKGGTFQMVQLWTNLPKKYKMTEPKYQELTFAQGKKYQIPNDGGYVHVVAGEYEGIQGNAETFVPTSFFDAHIKSGNELLFSFPKNHNTGLLVIEGNVTINGKDEVPADHFVLMSNDGSDFTVKADGDAIVLILSGEPIEETIVPYGPFVMNTKEEIQQAYEDYRSGKFGHLD
ncbi:MAG: pirin family protein [Candidatus Kapabacteria bacterium]|nr:pirin family protein [Ignavibacteriota bacterium]MCW5886002.1 pirin family protein [Candidatus Kapabacteria bacterium]